MVTRGPLLPLYGPGWRECRYLCASCGEVGVLSEQFVVFGPGDRPPNSLRLPCFGAALDARTGLDHVPAHLYVLAELEEPPAKQ